MVTCFNLFMWYVVLIFKDDIFRSDFLRSFMQFQHHNITSDKLSDQNNERFYHEKQTVENRRSSADRQIQVMKSSERHFFHYTERTYHCIIMHIFKKQKQTIIKLNKQIINLT
jgi:hypothetical protein